MIRSITIKANNIEGTAATFYDGIDNLEEYFFRSVFGASFSGPGITYVIEKDIDAITINTGAAPPPSVPDSLQQQMSTSLSSYNSALVGEWVKITAAEYDNIFQNVLGTIKKGNRTFQLTSPGYTGEIESIGGFREMQFPIDDLINDAVVIDIDEWVIAFATQTRDADDTVRFGHSTEFHTGSPIYGNPVDVTYTEPCYYVRKAPSGGPIAPATQLLYPSIKLDTNYFNLVPETSGWYTADGGTSWFPYNGNLENGAAKFQMLVTKTKSW